jgi:SAM-dependent methyltransferase
VSPVLPLEIEKYRDIPFEQRTHCVVCGEPLGMPVVQLPKFPMTEVYVNALVEEQVGVLDQELMLCATCGHGQLGRVIDVGLQYGDPGSYRFRTSQSSTASESSRFFVDFIMKHTAGCSLGTVVEVGCNDLYLLRLLKPMAKTLIGIDPILKGREQEYSEGSLVAIGDFFENISLDTKADVIICKDTLEHVAAPKQFVEKVLRFGHEDTLFFFQFPLLETLLEGCRFDQVFHQHLNYFSLQSVIRLLDDLGYCLLDYCVNRNHWGAGVLVFKKGTENRSLEKSLWRISPQDIERRYAIFRADMENTVARLSLFRDDRVYGYGAALMLPVLNYHLRQKLLDLVCIIDDDPEKEGLSYINMPVCIRGSRSIGDLTDAVVVVTAMFTLANARQILVRLFDLRPRQILIPMGTV